MSADSTSQRKIVVHPVNGEPESSKIFSPSQTITTNPNPARAPDGINAPLGVPVQQPDSPKVIPEEPVVRNLDGTFSGRSVTRTQATEPQSFADFLKGPQPQPLEESPLQEIINSVANPPRKTLGDLEIPDNATPADKAVADRIRKLP